MIDNNTYETLKTISPLQATLCIGQPELDRTLTGKFKTWQECLKSLGATEIDVLEHDGTGTIKQDLNEPFNFGPKYNTLLDCGKVEHVMNVGTCLGSYASSVKVTGNVVIVADSESPYGYYHINPQTFYSFFNTNGFETRVYRAGSHTKLIEEKSPETEDSKIEFPDYSICVAEKIKYAKHITWDMKDVPVASTGEFIPAPEPEKPKKPWYAPIAELFTPTGAATGNSPKN